MMNELPLVARLRMHRVVLKSGEFDGAQLMQAWCDMIQAADEIERLRQELREIITFAETRRQDGIEMGATVWRIALEDIIKDAQKALKL